MNGKLFRIDIEEGVMTTLWSDAYNLPSFGRLTEGTRRASHVEFDVPGQCWTVFRADWKVLATGFKTRGEALRWEESWANEEILSGAA